MTREECWVRAVMSTGDFDSADVILAEYDKRFKKEAGVMHDGRPYLYNLEDYALGVKIDGFTYYASWSDAFKQYVVKAEIGGFFSPPMYTNASTEEEFNIFLEQNGEYVFREAMKDAQSLFEQSKDN